MFRFAAVAGLVLLTACTLDGAPGPSSSSGAGGVALLPKNGAATSIPTPISP